MFSAARASPPLMSTRCSNASSVSATLAAEATLVGRARRHDCPQLSSDSGSSRKTRSRDRSAELTSK